MLKASRGSGWLARLGAVLAIAAAGLAVRRGLGRRAEGPSGSSIYRTPEGEAVFLALYDRALERLGTQFEHRWVETRFGSTHLLVAGPEDAPPVVVTHGGNSVNPISLEWFLPLLEEYRVYAPDMVGHPGHSAQTRLSPRGDGYGRWLVEVLEGLGLERAALVGGSYGAGIIVQAAACAPERISRAALVVPSGIVNPPMAPLILRLALPMMLYRWFPTRDRLVAAARPLFTPGEPIVELWLEAIQAAFDHLKVEAQMPHAATKEELARFTAPTLVIAAEGDLLFPGRAVVVRARELFPNLVAAELLEGSAHTLSRESIGYVQKRIRAFLAEGNGQKA